MTGNVREQTEPAAQSEVESAKAKLDAWVPEVVDFHFDPASGCPFWLEYAKNLSWDPRKEVKCFEDLSKFEPFQDEWLRGGPVERWVPKAHAGRPVYVFETGGTTGVPKSRINIEDFRQDYEMFSNTLSDEAFPRGADWLSIGPTGPRRLRLAVEHLAQFRGGICFCIDMDPRWFTKCLKRGWIEAAEAYKNHVIDQALTLIRAHPNIKCLFTTPKLLEALCDKINLSHAGITGIFCGGTQMDAKFHRLAREELLNGAEFVPTYGNTLMGLACHKPYIPEDDYSIIYYPPHPRAVLQVVNPDEPNQEVGYGESGRVKLTTLTKEFFVPGFLERDQGYRVEPISLYPWDGVRDVEPFSRFKSSVVVGVY
ncbi:MAG: hypothetical protein MK538_04025 [Planctomycetes bacterium]|nr:hypothetical protein [Planctomycetota bacterium]